MEKGFESKENGSEKIAFNSMHVKSVYFKHRIYLVQVLYCTGGCARCVRSEGTFLHGQIQWKAKIHISQTVHISAASILYFLLAHWAISFRLLRKSEKEHGLAGSAEGLCPKHPERGVSGKQPEGMDA